jgi:hypothetical protein
LQDGDAGAIRHVWARDVLGEEAKLQSLTCALPTDGALCRTLLLTTCQPWA